MAVLLDADHRQSARACECVAGNSERALWAAHVRAAHLLDDEPGPVARTIFDAVHHRWRPVFLDLSQ